MIPYFSKNEFFSKGLQETPSFKQSFPNTRSSYSYYQDQLKANTLQQRFQPQKYQPLRPLTSNGINSMLAPTSSNISIGKMALRSHIHFDDKLSHNGFYPVEYIEDPIIPEDILQTYQSSRSFEQSSYRYDTYTGQMGQAKSKFGNLTIPRETQEDKEHCGYSSSEDSIFKGQYKKREIKATEKTQKRNELKAEVPDQIKENRCGGKICSTTQIQKTQKTAIKSQQNNSTKIDTTVKRSQRLQNLSSRSGDVKDIQQEWHKARRNGKIQNFKVGFIEKPGNEEKKCKNKQPKTKTQKSIDTSKNSLKDSTKNDSQVQSNITVGKSSGNKAGNKKLKQDEACKSYFRGSRKVLRRIFHSYEETKMRYTYLWKDNVLWEKIQTFLIQRIKIKKPSDQEIAAMGLIIAQRFAPRKVLTFSYYSFITKIWHFTKSATLFDFFKENSFERMEIDEKNTTDQKNKSRQQLTYDMYNVYNMGHAMAESWERNYPPINHKEQSQSARTDAAQQ
eukprot:403351194